MTIAYFDCFSGISGDMTLGALLDAGADRAVLDAVVEALGRPPGAQEVLAFATADADHGGSGALLVSLGETARRGR